MAGFVAVELNANQAIKDIKNYAVNSAKKVKQAVNETALKVHAEARKNAPVDKGELREKIIIDWNPDEIENADGFTVDVVAKADHSAFVEYGTGVRGAASNHPPLPPDYKHGGGTKHKGAWPGMKAQPYMHPAAETARPGFEKDIKEAVK